MTEVVAPTPEEVEAAQEVLARQAQVELQDRYDKMEPAATIVNGQAFNDLYNQLEQVLPGLEGLDQEHRMLANFLQVMRGTQRIVGNLPELQEPEPEPEPQP